MSLGRTFFFAPYEEHLHSLEKHHASFIFIVYYENFQLSSVHDSLDVLEIL